MFQTDTGATRWSRTRGRNGSFSSGVSYPSPFFDVSHTYLPKSIKELFRWCRYFFLVHPLVNTVVFKLSQYPIRDVVYHTDDAGLRETWEDFLENELRYRSFQEEAGLDYYTYGNCLISILFPFVKMLKCPHCGNEVAARDANYNFRSYEFYLRCSKCGNAGKAEVEDRYIRTTKGIRLIRWNPEDVDVHFNQVSGRYTYYYKIPKVVRNDIIMGKKHVLEEVPQLFLESLKNRRAVVFSRENIYHFRRPTLSGEENGWGVPLILPVLKDSFYLQILKKAQECVSLSSEIETERGLIAADDVHVGDAVRTHTGATYTVEKKWYRAARQGEIGRKITLTSLRDFATTYSPCHPIFSIRRNKRARRKDTKDVQRSSVILRNTHLYEEALCPAEQLAVGQYVLYPRHLPEMETVIPVAHYTGLASAEEYVYSGCCIETGEAFEALERGERVPHDNPGRVAKRAAREGRTPNRMAASRPMTADLAYILGWYAGDGSCGSRHVAFSLGKGDDAAPLMDAIRREFSVEPTVEEGKSVNTVVLSNTIVRLLIKGMIPGTARHKKAPREILEGTNDVKLAYLLGLWEADGCDSSRIAISTSSRNQAYDAYRMLLHLGCITTIDALPPAESMVDGHRIEGKGGYNVNVCSASADRLRSLWKCGDGPEVQSGKSGFFWKEYFATRICAVEEAEEETYIDFKVSVDTTFCTPGTATKNSIALEHIVPLRALFPSSNEAVSAYNAQNLGDWKAQIATEIARWRRDANYIPLLSFPLGTQTIGGEGRALLLGQEIRIWSEQILAGMGVPQELIFGGVSFSGSNVSLRMLENFFIGYIQNHLHLLNWIIQGVSAYMNWEPIELGYKPFKMADDLQRQAYMSQLNESGKISDTTLLAGVDLEARTEDELLQKETDRRADALLKAQEQQAEIQGKSQLIMARYQARAQQEQQEAMMNAQPAPGEPGAEVHGMPQDAVAGPTVDMSSRLNAGQAIASSPSVIQDAGQVNLDLLAAARSTASYVNTLPPTSRDAYLMNLRAQSPEMYETVLSMINMGGGNGAKNTAGEALPEQRPPRRGPGTALV